MVLLWVQWEGECQRWGLGGVAALIGPAGSRCAGATQLTGETGCGPLARSLVLALFTEYNTPGSYPGHRRETRLWGMSMFDGR